MTPPKLSDLTPEQKTMILAELDGKSELLERLLTSYKASAGLLKDYLRVHKLNYRESFDAITPLVQKICSDPKTPKYIWAKLNTLSVMKSASQLCDAVLVATGKAVV